MTVRSAHYNKLSSLAVTEKSKLPPSSVEIAAMK